MAYSDEYRQRAFELFYALGDNRSLEKLQAVLKKKYNKAPAIRCLYQWEKKYQWVKHIKGLVPPRIEGSHKKELEKIAVENFIAKAELRALGGYALRRAYQELEAEGVSILDKETASSFATVADKAIALVKAAAVEEGGVSDRVAEESTLDVTEHPSDTSHLIERLMGVKRSNDNKIAGRAVVVRDNG